jgi:hypothetical protein
MSIRPAGTQTFESAWRVMPLLGGARNLRERITFSLFPTVEIAKSIFSAETHLQTEDEIANACDGPGPHPFLLRGSRLYAFSQLNRNPVFAPALMGPETLREERLSDWLSCPERASWAVELLNRSLRFHAWKRGLRFDPGHNLFYFTRSKPKNVWWEIGGKTIRREVTAPHMKRNRLGENEFAEYQCGWKHEAIRAGFVRVSGKLLLRLEPAWFLTELDGKSAATNQPVEVLEPYKSIAERNVQAICALRFWSDILAKGHRELRIETGTSPIRVRLIPAAVSKQFTLASDQPDFDVVAASNMDSLQLIPELSPIEA